MTTQERLQKITGFVINHLQEMARLVLSSEHDPIYRWDHTLRVACYGQQIAQAEGGDVEVVIAACVLHDVAHFDQLEDHKDHGRQGARISRTLL
jgi:putative nucleotidyltransferase with HDIG domain